MSLPHTTIEPPLPKALEDLKLEFIISAPSHSSPMNTEPPVTAKESTNVALYMYALSPCQSIAPP